MQRYVCIYLYYLLTCFSSSSYTDDILPQTNDYLKQFSLLFSKSEILSRECEKLELGIVIFSKVDIVKDMIDDWLLNTRWVNISSLTIMSRTPSNNTSSFTDTFVFMDSFDSNLRATLDTLFKATKVFKREARYVFVLTNPIQIESLKAYIRLLWVDVKLLNFLVVFWDYLNILQVVSYNPFKYEFTTHSNKQGHTYGSMEFFPRKLKNLNGYQLKIYLVNNSLYLRDIEFTMAFIKTLNASVQAILKKDMREISNEVSSGRVDMVGVALFSLEYFLKQAGYPHGFMEFVVLVENAEQITTLGTLLSLFDLYVWIFMIVVLILLYGSKWVYSLVLHGHPRYKSGISLRMLIFLLGVFNIIFTQTFQSWVITFLIRPKEATNINTIDDLIKSKLTIHSLRLWEEFMNTRLNYNYQDNDYFDKLENATAKGEGYVVPQKFASDLLLGRKNEQEVYHQVQERIGTAYLIFYLGQNSPYSMALKDFTLISLQCGFMSKTWGQPVKSDTQKERRKVDKIKLKHLSGVFTLWAVGLMMGGLCFAVELFYYQGRFKKTMNNLVFH